jgi:hypothetical protein
MVSKYRPKKFEAPFYDPVSLYQVYPDHEGKYFKIYEANKVQEPVTEEIVEFIDFKRHAITKREKTL